METYEETIKELQEQVKHWENAARARDKLLCEANDLLKTFLPARPKPYVEKDERLATRRGSWRAVNKNAEKMKKANR